MAGPVLLDAAVSASDPLALIIAAGAGAISLLMGIVIAMVSSHAKRLEKKVDSLEDDKNKMWLSATKHEGRMSTLEKAVEALERDTLPAKEFETRMTFQDKKLEGIDRKIETIDDGLAKRPTTSQLIPAAQVYRQDRRIVEEERRDDRRDDTDPPPTRPKLPSRR